PDMETLSTSPRAIHRTRLFDQCHHHTEFHFPLRGNAPSRVISVRPTMSDTQKSPRERIFARFQIWNRQHIDPSVRCINTFIHMVRS
ncbi:MAG: hypothetical protein AAGU05_14015, partial [Anaerolineaceae bacterium]